MHIEARNMSFSPLHRPKRCFVTGRTFLRTKATLDLIHKRFQPTYFQKIAFELPRLMVSTVSNSIMTLRRRKVIVTAIIATCHWCTRHLEGIYELNLLRTLNPRCTYSLLFVTNSFFSCLNSDLDIPLRCAATRVASQFNFVATTDCCSGIEGSQEWIRVDW